MSTPFNALPTFQSLTPEESAKKEFLQVDPITGSIVSGGKDFSLFSPWYVFKYTGGVSEVKIDTYVQARSEVNTASRKQASNPTAAAIVEWGKTLPAKGSTFTQWSAPYSWSDFIFCKLYGVVSNNRMITLRKYPVAVDDTARPGRRKDNKSRYIPIAQAVTWFGEGTGNDINTFWQNKWSMPWEKKPIDQKDVEGNEIVNFGQALKKIFKDNGATNINPLFSSVLDIALTVSDMDLKPNESGYQSSLNDNFEKIATSEGKASIEQKRQDFIKGLYSDNGAYFNQILGPVNVKNKFLMRSRGLSGDSFDEEMSLTFEFRTDSYFGLDQRRVALDILANMLELTYSDGDWLEVLNVYYKKVGLALTKTEQAMVSDSMRGSNFNPDRLFNALAKITKARVSAALDFTLQAGGQAINAGTNFLGSLAGLNNIATADTGALKTAMNVAVVRALGETFPAFVQRRSAVGNQPTGNWHITIGNPINPIMQMGDVVVTGATCTFNDELGPNDFPTEMKFVVSLKRTKPKDSADIRRAFDLGRTDYIDVRSGGTTDQFNTYGTQATDQTARAAGSQPGDGVNSNINFTRAESWIKNRYGSDIWSPDTQALVNDVYFYMPQASKDMPAGSAGDIQMQTKRD
jgi:hypothetical protein